MVRASALRRSSALNAMDPELGDWREDNLVALPYCKPCRSEDMPPIAKHIKPVKPNACHPCVRCGDIRYES